MIGVDEGIEAWTLTLYDRMGMKVVKEVSLLVLLTRIGSALKKGYKHGSRWECLLCRIACC